MLPLDSSACMYDSAARRALQTPHTPKIEPPWDTVYRKVSLLHASPAHQFWWSSVGRVLAILLHNAQYDQGAQLRQLMFFASVVVPYLGQIPTPASTGPWKSFMTDDGNPIELSWEWRVAGVPPKIRFSIEPIGPHAGTKSDPHNAFASADFLDHLLASLPEVDARLYKHLRTQLLCENQSDVLDLEGHKTTTFFAFDLEGARISAKAYFFPGFRARQLGKCTADLISAAIRTSPGLELIDFRPLSMFEDFLAHWQGLPLEVEMLSIDLKRPPQSRFKIYFRSRETDFIAVKQIMSFGGRLRTEELETGLEDLRRLWDDLFNVDSNSGPSLPSVEHRTAGILYYVEFKPGSQVPTTKIYIPVRHYALNDGNVIRKLATYLKSHHRDVHLSSFMGAIYSAFNSSCVEQEIGLQTYLGISINPEGGLRVVSYLNPQPHKISKDIGREARDWRPLNSLIQLPLLKSDKITSLI